MRRAHLATAHQEAAGWRPELEDIAVGRPSIAIAFISFQNMQAAYPASAAMGYDVIGYEASSAALADGKLAAVGGVDIVVQMPIRHLSAMAMSAKAARLCWRK